MKLPDADNRSFWDHAEEFRRRLLWCALACVLGVAAAFSFSSDFIQYAGRCAGRLMFLSPAEAFIVRLQTAVILGIVIVSPVWIYHIFIFLQQGLLGRERLRAAHVVTLIFLLTCAGAVFADRILVPVSFDFLLSFGNDVLRPMLTAREYLSFYFSAVLFCCLLFNMPVVFVSMVLLRIVRIRTLQHYRRYVFIFCLVASALLTPPDAATQILMAGPLYVLYELSILGARVFEK